MALVLPSRYISHRIIYKYLISAPKLDLHYHKNNRQYFSLMKENTGQISSSIEAKIKASLHPSYLEVINESYQHNVPPGSETHFKVVIVSAQFDEMPSVKRHRLVYEILSSELNSGVHALSIVAKSPSQWEKSNQIVEKSPPCRGGFGK